MMHFYEMFDERMAPIEKLLSEKYGFKIKFAALINPDHSSGHTAMADDAVDEKNLNKGPGGKKGTMMRDTVFTDAEGLIGAKGDKHPQRMTIGGESIGALQCALERGVQGASTMKLEGLVAALGKYDDFQAEKVSGRWVERDTVNYNEANGSQHAILWVPKFHCELAWVSLSHTHTHIAECLIE